MRERSAALSPRSAGFEEERAASEARVQDLGKLLHQAVADIQSLQVRGRERRGVRERGSRCRCTALHPIRHLCAYQARNAELQRQLLEAAAWEPSY